MSSRTTCNTRRRGYGPGAHTCIALALLATATSPVVAHAQSINGSGLNGSGDAAPPSARPTMVTAPPVIDGRLDDAAWQEAELVAGFVQREPEEGNPVSERTEVRILMDEKAILFGAWLYDRTPSEIVAGERIRDASLTNSDHFGIILDTYHDRQNGFIFSTTPTGIEYDGQVSKEGTGGGVFQRGQTRQQAGSMGGFNVNWDAEWDVATSVDDQGWYAEFRIPFSTLRYGSGNVQTWGLNFVRSIRRRNEEAFWSPIPRQFNLMRLSMAGTLRGIRVPFRQTVILEPYALASTGRDFDFQNEFDEAGDVGVDAKIGVTPSLTLDLTYNTDFAQTEVDQQQTNLTRFPLFFPEKRRFFLENGGVFSAGTPQAADLFFSRRIGITDEGTEAPVIGGGRLSGKAGGVTLGVLQIFTEEVAGVDALGQPYIVQPTNAYSVARATRELPNRSRVGGIFVQRMSVDNSGDRNRTYGLDGRVGLGDAITVDMWAAKTETPGLTGADEAFTVRAEHRTRDWRNWLRFLQVGEDFNPEVGFLSRDAYRLYEGNIMRFVRVPSVPWIRQLNPHITYRGYFDLTGFQESGWIHMDTELEFSGGGRIGPELNFRREGLSQPFEISPGVIIPPGTYDYFENGWDIGSNPSAPLSLRARLNLGGFYSGKRWGGNATLTWRKWSSFTSEVRVDYNYVDLPYGPAFETTLVGARLGYFFTPRIRLQSLIQYNNQAEIWSANFRFAWLQRGGTGLFVVYNETQESFAFDPFNSLNRPLNRSFIVKFSRQFNVLGF